ncbi:MAG: DinB family protein [Armatimonadetes bacterium]|nr:DinB family protein [Armatimonadota bacterium]
MEVKDIAVNVLKRTVKLFTQDLEALPEEAYTKSFGANARTVADLVYEVDQVNDHIVSTVLGENPPDWSFEGWVRAPEDFQSKEAVIAGFKASTDRAIAMAEGLSEDQMSDKVVTEWGETTKYERCRFMATHMMYHSGQLNFIQTLLGDTEWHWA